MNMKTIVFIAKGAFYGMALGFELLFLIVIACYMINDLQDTPSFIAFAKFAKKAFKYGSCAAIISGVILAMKYVVYGVL